MFPDIPYIPAGNRLIDDDNWWILENPYALPLGFFYDSVISYSDSLHLSKAERRELLLQSAVVEDNSPLLFNYSLNRSTDLSWEMMQTLEQAAVQFSINPLDEGAGIEIVLEECVADKRYLILYLDINSKEFGPGIPNQFSKSVTVQWADETGEFLSNNTRSFAMALGDDQLLIDITAQDVKYIKVTEDFIWSFDVIALSAVDDSYFNVFRENVSARKSGNFEFTRLWNTHIEGYATLDAPALLCVSFAFESGWEATVNGEATEIHMLNNGLMGLMLDAGENKVVMKYSPFQDTVFTYMPFVSLVIWIGVIIFQIMSRKKTLVSTNQKN
jgi:uncharacterized membrane protein YfhO